MLPMSYLGNKTDCMLPNASRSILANIEGPAINETQHCTPNSIPIKMIWLANKLLGSSWYNKGTAIPVKPQAKSVSLYFERIVAILFFLKPKFFSEVH